MKKIISVLLLALSVRGVQGAFGYINHTFYPGDNYFSNPLESETNTLDNIFQSSSVPEGSVVSLWDSTQLSFNQSSVFQSGTWSVNLVIEPGLGARLRSPVIFTNTFLGFVLNPDGSIWAGETIQPPPQFSGPDGIYLAASKTPFSLSGTDVFLYIWGRLPFDDEQFMRLDSDTQTYRVTTYSKGAWSDGDPVLQPGESAFFNLGPNQINLTPSVVPEPAVGALSAAICAAMWLCRRQKS